MTEKPTLKQRIASLFDQHNLDKLFDLTIWSMIMLFFISAAAILVARTWQEITGSSGLVTIGLFVLLGMVLSAFFIFLKSKGGDYDKNR